MNESPELVEAFRVEALSHLDAFEQRLIAADDSSPEAVKELFIAVHTIKGGAAMLEMKGAWTLSAAMEDVLFQAREGNSFPDAQTSLLLLQGSGILRRFVTLSENGDPGGIAEHLASRLREQLADGVQREPAAQATRRPAPRAFRVLLVDESPASRMTQAMALKNAGFEVDSVADGHDALRRIRQTAYDLLVAGSKAKGMSALDLAADARLATRGESLAIIVAGQKPVEDGVPSDLDIAGWVPAGAAGQRQLVALARSIREQKRDR